MKEKIGIIGFGNMGKALTEQLKAEYRIFVFDNDPDKIKGLSDVTVAGNNVDLADKSDTVILAVKPQDSDSVLDKIKEVVKNKLVVSIAAGITTGYIEKILGTVRVVRVMPNIAVRVGEGVSCLAAGKFAGVSDLEYTENLFDYLGETLDIKEDLMNSATAVCGSGPGFCYYLMQLNKINRDDFDSLKCFVKETFMPMLSQAAKRAGFSQGDAEFLARGTANGCIALLKKTKFSLLELMEQIASKGGTTEAGLKVLEKGGTLEEAVMAALARAGELCVK